MRILIIGGDAAGMSAAMQIRRRRPDWKVVALEKGTYTSYAACGIPYLVAGDVASLDELVAVSPEEFRSRRGVDVKVGWEAVAIDLREKTVAARTGTNGMQALAYDRLLIATGGQPLLPPWPGIDLEGIVPVRNLFHAARLLELLAARPRRCVVVGAGYIGLEMAEALRRRELQVTVVEKLDGVMGGAEAQITERVREEMERHGVELRLQTTVEGFAGEDGKLQAVLTDREVIPADLAVIALGVRPNVSLAEEAGIPLGDTGAIRVDIQQRTGVTDVFAAGDCCEANHLVLGRPVYMPLALTANRQGRIAGTVMAGDVARFPGIVGSAVTRIFDLTLARTGIEETQAKAEQLPFDTVEVSAPSRAHYFPGQAPLWIKLVFRTDNQKLLGAWLVGRDPSAGKRVDILATAISGGMSIEQIADLDLTYAPPFSPVWDPVLQAANKARFALASARTVGD